MTYTGSGIEVVITGLTRNLVCDWSFRPTESLDFTRDSDGSNLENLVCSCVKFLHFC